MSLSPPLRDDSPKPAWYRQLLSFRRPSWRSASIQLANTLVPFFTAMIGMMWLIDRTGSYWWLLATPVASLLLVRVFIIFHDCCHGSFSPSRRANRVIGYLTGTLTFTPFEQWRRGHLTHHATNSQLDHRGIGDVYTMTFEEFSEATPGRRLGYRLLRHPIIMFVFGPFYVFFLESRLPRRGAPKEIVRSVWLTNSLMVVVGAIWSLLFGFTIYLVVQTAVMWLAGAVGIWLFYVQHQFDPGYWARDDEWSVIDASMSGSSYYRLPRVLQWLTGNIGLHHIHHLNPGIPNYRLEEALEAVPEEASPTPITIATSLRSLSVHLWHEAERRFISFGEARRLRSG